MFFPKNLHLLRNAIGLGFEHLARLQDPSNKLGIKPSADFLAPSFGEDEPTLSLALPFPIAEPVANGMRALAVGV
jgi:hypothetical protein